MADIISSVASGLIIAVVGWIAGGFYRQLQSLRASLGDERKRAAEHEVLMEYMTSRQAHDRLVDEALRALLLSTLESQQDRMVDNHGVADNDAKARAQRVYDVYHNLGGNGHGTQVNNDIQNAPIKPKEE